MKRLLSITLALLFAMTALPALADNSQNPYVSRDEPHATLRLNGGVRVHGLIPLNLLSINGHVTLKQGIDVVYLKPGKYRLGFNQPGIRNRGHVPDAPGAFRGTTTWRETDDTLDITLKPGMVYFIAGKPHGNGAWTVAVWDKKSQE
ncbi:hypothetical protein [Dyella sp.]|uniref:hypothetical protein n=1 Tax=Dyella sp. TaxID=1869338 RepID=UPI002D7780B0|nr:hypothetical protein [Dyella sp.]HET7332859.1 hypothetical protein [Dyella sp.]HET7371182.1 hypothetical protein [Gammaproteobacteria bacterium]